MTASWSAMTAPRFAAMSSSQPKNRSCFSPTPSSDNNSYATTLRIVNYLHRATWVLDRRPSQPELIVATGCRWSPAPSQSPAPALYLLDSHSSDGQTYNVRTSGGH